MDINFHLSFESSKPGSTKGVVLLMQGDKILHSDTLDIAKDEARMAFLSRVNQRYPGLPKETLCQQLLDKVGEIKSIPFEPDQTDTEVDVTSVVRPQLFHTPNVSGMLIPLVVRSEEQGLTGVWHMYRQWADGRREQALLTDSLSTSDGNTLHFHPLSPTPEPNTAPQWTSVGREKWLDETYTPSLDAIYYKLVEKLSYFLEFPPDEAAGNIATLTLWVMLTYCYTCWPAVPYLWVGGPQGSGKSRVFDILSKVVFRPLSSSNMTAACLFRTLHAHGGTLLLDEAEQLRDQNAETAQIMSILLAGYKAGSKANRTEKVGDSYRPVSFDVYGPKALACIAGLNPVLASRTIRIMMFRAPKSSPVPARRIDENPAIWSDIRDDLHAFSLSYGHQFTSIAAEHINCPGIGGRSMELWQPLFALAKLVENAGVEGLLEKLQAHARQSVEKIEEDTIPEVDEIVLKEAKQAQDRKPEGFTAAQILSAARLENEVLFARYSARGISAILVKYGIRSHRVGGKRLLRPTPEQFKSIGNSYGIDFD